VEPDRVEAEAFRELHSVDANTVGCGRKAVEHLDVVVSIPAEIDWLSIEE
jgi:hypothetical protein